MEWKSGGAYNCGIWQTDVFARNSGKSLNRVYKSHSEASKCYGLGGAAVPTQLQLITSLSLTNQSNHNFWRNSSFSFSRGAQYHFSSRRPRDARPAPISVKGTWVETRTGLGKGYSKIFTRNVEIITVPLVCVDIPETRMRLTWLWDGTLQLGYPGKGKPRGSLSY